ncbi:hypothetical protein NIES4074_25820 [Cylindrospermum sp. NIES-4074]|nr:hypothetical protein NIES4074_25820 [Cylindrospermum sp. NIES-4074]
MKNIPKITRRLMLVFMAFVASSMMFLSSPAIAATSSATSRLDIDYKDYDLATSPVTIVDLTPDNFETEVVKSTKPVLVFILPELDSTKTQEALKGIKYVIDARLADENDVYPNAESDKYKFAVGKRKDFADKVEEINKKWDEDEEKGIHDNDEYYEKLLSSYDDDGLPTNLLTIIPYLSRDSVTANTWYNGHFVSRDLRARDTLGLAYNGLERLKTDVKLEEEYIKEKSLSK